MIKYKRTYLDYFGYGEQDYIPSEVSGKRAVDVHHLVFRSHGGSDEIENLIALTREEHDLAHRDQKFNEDLKKIHSNKLKECT